MTKTIGMAAATFLAVCGAFAALGDTVEEREKRTEEIAQWLPAEPKADGAFDVHYGVRPHGHGRALKQARQIRRDK